MCIFSLFWIRAGVENTEIWLGFWMGESRREPGGLLQLLEALDLRGCEREGGRLFGAIGGRVAITAAHTVLGAVNDIHHDERFRGDHWGRGGLHCRPVGAWR
jgi:hypothetical protein